MEVTMYHPDNKEGKVLVTSAQQYAGYIKMGFVDAPEKGKDDLKAASTPALKAEPTADASKDVPEGQDKQDVKQKEEKNSKSTTTSGSKEGVNRG